MLPYHRDEIFTIFILQFDTMPYYNNPIEFTETKRLFFS